MTTEARSEASRQNGAKSNGPTTSEGKTISSANALRHGLTAKRLLLNSEEPERFFTLSGAYYDKFVPVDDVERDIVDDMVVSKWRQRRDWSSETALFELEMDSQTEKVAAQYDKISNVGRYALAFRALADESKSIQLLNRYETGHRRSYYKAMNTLPPAPRRAEKEPDPRRIPGPAPRSTRPGAVQPEKNQDVNQAQPAKEHFCETNPRNDERPTPEPATNGENSKIGPAPPDGGDANLIK